LLDLHRETPVKLNAEIAEMDISSDRAIPLGLILNEFTTNSLKYAFDEAGGTISLRAVRVGDERVRMGEVYRLSPCGPGRPQGRAWG
jgi:two-component sensor histidine kinase